MAAEVEPHFQSPDSCDFCQKPLRPQDQLFGTCVRCALKLKKKRIAKHSRKPDVET